MSRKNPWDEVAQIYEEGRPSYPDQLIQDIIKGAHLSPGDRLLEIGAGTGKATVQLAERGFRVHCVEPGPNLADILIRKCSRHPNVTVDVAWFEEWRPRNGSKFDLVLSAQAFNWIDPEIRYRKAHQLLAEGGHLALFWYGHAHEAWESDIVSSGLFDDPQVFRYPLDVTCSADTFIKAMESASTFAALDDDTKSRMRNEARRKAEQHGGFVTSRLNYTLYLAKKI